MPTASPRSRPAAGPGAGPISVGALLVLAAGLAAARPAGGREALLRPASPDAADAQWHEASLVVGESERWYRTYAPAPSVRKAPVVLLLHGGTQSMRRIFGLRSGGTRAWLDLAKTEGVLLVAPNGTNPATGDTRGDRQSWNDLRSGGEARASTADDVAFLRALVDLVHRRHDTDPDRTYVTGASNGGMMTYRLLIEAPEPFAAGAAFIASLPHEEVALATPSRPTPLMIANGTRDPLVRWEGGEVAGNRGRVRSTDATVRWWVAANAAGPDPARSTELPDADPADGCRIRLEEYAPQPQGAPIFFYTIDGGGHALPSRGHEIARSVLVRRLVGPVCRDAEGAELAWAFLRRFTRGAQAP